MNEHWKSMLQQKQNLNLYKEANAYASSGSGLNRVMKRQIGTQSEILTLPRQVQNASLLYSEDLRQKKNLTRRKGKDLSSKDQSISLLQPLVKMLELAREQGREKWG